MQLVNALLLVVLISLTSASHPARSRHVRRQSSQSNSNSTVQLIITNQCSDTIWPGIQTDNGTGPTTNGFALPAGSSQNLTVGADWNGRVWSRTNCTFNSTGSGGCFTGDCGGQLNCTIPGAAATLAEFNLLGWDNLSFYDISLVDGYNLPLAILVAPSANASSLPPANQTNPACVASVADAAPPSFAPDAPNQAPFLNTNASWPASLDVRTGAAALRAWCPYDLQANAAHAVAGKGRCPCLADDGAAHPAFNPCLSACARYGAARLCCAGKYGEPSKCGPNYYSVRAKAVCPDAYSFAFDDASSTFAVPHGQVAGWEVRFCPGGRSTVIRRTLDGAAGRAGWSAWAGALVAAVVVWVSVGAL